MTLTAPPIFDSDLFDIEIEIDRIGLPYFNKARLGALLGIATQTVGNQVRNGVIPPPHHYEDVGWDQGSLHAVWSAAQVVEILYERRKPKPPVRLAERAPCGTLRGYSQYSRWGEPIDEACRLAKYEANRMSNFRSQQRKMAARAEGAA